MADSGAVGEQSVTDRRRLGARARIGASAPAAGGILGM